MCDVVTGNNRADSVDSNDSEDSANGIQLLEKKYQQVLEKDRDGTGRSALCPFFNKCCLDACAVFSLLTHYLSLFFIHLYLSFIHLKNVLYSFKW